MSLLCALRYVTVLWCHPAAQQYVDATAAVPPEHWRLVKPVAIRRQDHGAMTIGAHPGHLAWPAARSGRVLWHEAEHLVGERHGRRVGQT